MPSDPKRCSECGRSLGGLMSADASRPGLHGLLRGEGSDRLMGALAWIFAMAVVFTAAMVCFWALGQGL